MGAASPLPQLLSLHCLWNNEALSAFLPSRAPHLQGLAQAGVGTEPTEAKVGVSTVATGCAGVGEASTWVEPAFPPPGPWWRGALPRTEEGLLRGRWAGRVWLCPKDPVQPRWTGSLQPLQPRMAQLPVAPGLAEGHPATLCTRLSPLRAAGLGRARSSGCLCVDGCVAGT